MAKPTSDQIAEEIALAYDGPLQEAVLSVLTRLKGDAKIATIEAFIVSGDLPGLSAYLTRNFPLYFADVVNLLNKEVTEAGQWAIEQANAFSVATAPAPGTQGRFGILALPAPEAVFNPVNPATLAALRVWQGNMIQEMDVSLRGRVTEIVTEGIRNGAGPRETARVVRDTIGLTSGQARAVQNFRIAINDIAERSIHSAQGWGLYTPRQIEDLRLKNPALYRNLNFTTRERQEGRRWAKISRAAGTQMADQTTGIKPSAPIGFVGDPETQGGVNAYRISADGKPIDGMTEWRLRDKRMDPTIYNVMERQEALTLARAARLPPDQIAALQGSLDEAKAALKAQAGAMEEQYRSRMLQYRSQMIARTESMRAANLGQFEGYRQAIAQGLIQEKQVVKTWITANDDRVRLTHRAAQSNPGNKKIPTDQPFVVDGDRVMYPPHSVNCRCASRYEIILTSAA